MAKLTTRSLSTSTVSTDNLNKGTALTHTEMDSNFLNLNTDKLETTGPATFNGDLTITATSSSAVGSIVLPDNDANYNVSLKAPATLSETYSLALPVADGTANQVLTTNGSGQLQFQSIAGDITQIAITAGTGLTGSVTTATGDHTQTLAIDSSVVTDTGSFTLTNKSIDADNNTITNLEVDNLKSGVLDTDISSVSTSDDTLASAKAIKTYVDAQILTKDNTDEITEGSTNLYFTNGRADARIAAASINDLSDVTTTGVSNGQVLKYNSTSGNFEPGADSDDLSNNDTDDLNEGSTNLYFTNTRVDNRLATKTTADISEGSNLYFTNERVDDRVNALLQAGTNITLTYDDSANTLTIASTDTDTGITDVVQDTTPQLGGDLDTQAFALKGTDVLPSTGSYGGHFSGGEGVRLHNSTSDHLIRTQQASGRQNIAFITDIDGSYSAGNSGSGLIYSPLNMQVRDRGESTKTRTTFDIGVPYVAGTGATITQGSVTGKLLDVVAADRKIYLQGVSGGTFATSTATTGVVTGTVTAVNSIGTNAVELTYDTNFNSTAATSDLASVGFARFSARDVLNTSGMRTSEPELHLEGGRIALESNGTKMIDIKDSGGITADISTGQTFSPFGGILSDPTNQFEIKGGRYASGLRIYDGSVGDGTKSGFQLDPFHFDKYLGSPQKKGGQFSVQLFGEGLPKEAYSNFTEGSATGVHQKFEIKDNSDYYQTTVNVTNGDATVNDADTGTITGVSGSSGGNAATKSGTEPFSALGVGYEVTITGAGSGGADLVTTITDINDDKDELTLADNIETTVSGVSLTFNSGVFRRMTAGDIIRIEGAVSNSNGFAMSGNLVSKISSVATGNGAVELDLTSSQLNDIITGSNKNATVVLNSSTAIRMSAGTTGATHTFTHKSEQNGTGLDSNDRVNLAFEAKKITFQAGTDSSNVNAIQAENDKVVINDGQNDIDFRIHGSSTDDVFKVDAGDETVIVKQDLKSTSNHLQLSADATNKNVILKAKDAAGTLNTVGTFRNNARIQNTTAGGGTNETLYDAVLDTGGIRVGTTAENFSNDGSAPDTDSNYPTTGIIVSNATKETWPQVDIISYGGANPLYNRTGSSGLAEFPNAALSFKAARGTEGSATAIQTNDRLGGVFWNTHDGTAFGGSAARSSASLEATAAENASSSNDRGAKITFNVMPTGGDGSKSSRDTVINAEGDGVQLGNLTTDKYLDVDVANSQLVLKTVNKITTGTNEDLTFDPNGTGDVITQPTLPSGDYGPGHQFGWNGNDSGGSAHINSVLSVAAGETNPRVEKLYNEGIQISSTSNGDGSDYDFSWPSLVFCARDKEGTLTSPNTNRASNDQGYGNVWFVKENRDATNTTQTGVESNQILGGFFGAGSKDSSSLAPTSARMFMRATEDFSSSANGTRMEFAATANGTTSPTQCLDINGDSVVINEDSNDVDFRVESNNEANAIKVDAGTDTVSLETIIVMMPNLPTSDPTNAGQLWNDSGTLKISAG